MTFNKKSFIIGAISLFYVAQIITFILLKLFAVLCCSWWWILLPILLPPVIILLFVGILVVSFLFISAPGRWRNYI